MRREETLPQRHHLREIQVEPRHLPVVYTFEAGVQATADVHHHAVGVLCQERAHSAVEFAGAQADVQLLEALPIQFGEVVGQLRDDFYCFRIVDQSVGAAAFGGAVGQW